MNKEPENEVKGCFSAIWEIIVLLLTCIPISMIGFLMWRPLLFIAIVIVLFNILKYIIDAWRRGTW